MSEHEAVQSAVEYLVRRALAEDVGSGDVTTAALIPQHLRGVGRVVAKEDLVVAGFTPFRRVFEALSPHVVIRFPEAEGAELHSGGLIAELRGPYGALLTGERTALNFLQHLSGIATLTREYVRKISRFTTILLDTRKTLPGWRLLEKEAVRLGGGTNHRMGLYDALLIKENHIAACGTIADAVATARSHCPDMKIEVEVRTLEELREALHVHPDIIMLDNMNLDDMRTAVRESAGRVPLEASGNVCLDTIEQIASTGVNYISVGALTHSARAADISMLIEPLNA